MQASTLALNFRGALHNTRLTLQECLSGVQGIVRLSSKGYLILILRNSKESAVLNFTVYFI